MESQQYAVHGLIRHLQLTGVPTLEGAVYCRLPNEDM